MRINQPHIHWPILTLLAMTLFMAACGDDDPELTVADTEPTTTDDIEADATPTPPDPVAEEDVETEGAVDETDEQSSDSEAAEEDSGSAALIPSGGEAVPTPTQGPTEGEPAFTAASKLTTVGLDEIFFGDPVDFAGEVASTAWIGLPDEGSRPQCYTVQPVGGPTGIYFTVMDGFIERVDISNPLITTRSGAGIGSSEQGLIELFGDSLETSDVGDGKEIVFVPSDAEDRQFRIVWTTDGTAVVHMRAGRIPGVMTTSPCG
jgi:hypothetical protein